MEVLWLEQTMSDVSAEADWLSLGERQRMAAMRIPKRRDDWLLGRWTAKHAVAAYLQIASNPTTLASIEIRPATSGAPEAFVCGKPAAVSISLSHREGTGACVVTKPGVALGCDLEVVEPRCDAFITDYFTRQEQELVACAASDAERFRVLALQWSAKESTLKALRTGLRLDTRCIAVDLDEAFARAVEAEAGTSGCGTPSADSWYRMRTRYSNQVFEGWWDCDGNFVRTIVSLPASTAPVPLKITPKQTHSVR